MECTFLTLQNIEVWFVYPLRDIKTSSQKTVNSNMQSKYVYTHSHTHTHPLRRRQYVLFGH